MKLSLKKGLACLIVLLITLAAKSQNTDYVITVNNDSLRCTIKTAFISQVSSYTVGNNKSVKIKPDEIKEYYIAEKNKRFKSVIVDGKKKPEFMDVIEEGKINFYSKLVTTPAKMSQGPNLGSFHGVAIGPPTTITPASIAYHYYVSKGDNIVKEVANFNTSINIFFDKKQKGKTAFAEMISDNKEVFDLYMAEKKFDIEKIQSFVHLYNTAQPAR